MLTFFKNLLADESGQGIVEYGLIIVLVAVVVFVTLTFLGDRVRELYPKISDLISAI